jgi:hypothetical protein
MTRLFYEVVLHLLDAVSLLSDPNAAENPLLLIVAYVNYFFSLHLSAIRSE